jgi:hypothetical protein
MTLRRDFITFLYAIAISEIAIQLYPILKAAETTALERPALAYLALMMIIISASWVGWYEAIAGRTLKRVWDKEFILLLIDVVIVSTYFLMVKSIGQGKTHFAWHATRGLVVVFASYVVWDLLFLIGAESKYRKFPVISAVCLGLTLVAAIAFGDSQTDQGIIFGELSLLGLALFFRAWQESFGASSAHDWRNILDSTLTWQCCVSAVSFALFAVLAWREG